MNHEDKIQFIRDSLSKKSLDDISFTFETHPSGSVHRVFTNPISKRKTTI